ncbi:MAG TPA: ribose-phosphate diphosphokinase [Myxococcaceae bacterium]|nr:ribose-phosphate diphosphokinase [Myxococcaceae bacterium]
MTMLLFSTVAYRPLRERMLQEEGALPGEVETHHFPDGERYQRILTDVDGKDVALLAGTISEADTLELFDLASGLIEEGARTLTLLMPYYGHATMERAVRPGEIVTAKTRARLISAIPLAPGGNRLFVLDVHTEGLPYYFEGSIRPHHLYAKPLILEVVRGMRGEGEEEVVLACTDAGRAKWVESLANDLGIHASFVFKRRDETGRTHVTAMSAQVEGRRVVLYDDMIRTGGSLIGAARAYRDAGAVGLSAVATHGLFPEGSMERLHGSGLFDRIVVTDSHPRVLPWAGKGLEVVSVAPLLMQVLRGHP